MSMFQSTPASPAGDTAEEAAAAVSAEATAADAQSDANPAGSSTADTQDAKQEGPQSLMDVIKDVVKVEETPQGDSSDPEDGQAKQPEEGEAEADPKPVADADLPFHNHPRWKEVLQERDALREPAEQYGKITAFMQATGLQPEEVAEGFEVMAMLKSGAPEDLTKALDYFERNTAELRKMLGVELPEDLRTKVDDGFISAEDATALARSRAEAELLRGQSERERQAREEAAAHAARQQAAAGVTNAVVEWEARQKASDPDYAKKAELVELKARALMLKEGPPATPEAAVQLVEKALKEVNGLFKAAAPSRQPIAPMPAGKSVETTPQPQNLRDVVRGALAGGR